MNSFNPYPIIFDRLPNKPFVSILIRNFNYGIFLDECISSVLSQTYEFFEVLIFDDGSSDSSREIIYSFKEKDPRISIFFSSNKGQVNAQNKLASSAKGDLICFLDADDLWAPSKIFKVVSAFNHFFQVGMVTHRLGVIDGLSKRISNPWKYRKYSTGWLAQDLVKGKSLHFPPTSGLSIRKELVPFIFPIDIKAGGNDDTIIRETCALISITCAIEEELGYLRLHGNNSAMTNKKNTTSPFALKKTIKAFKYRWQKRKFLIFSFFKVHVDERIWHNEIPSAMLSYILMSKTNIDPKYLFKHLPNLFSRLLFRFLFILPKKQACFLRFKIWPFFNLHFTKFKNVPLNFIYSFDKIKGNYKNINK